jgi:hypothetical protein
LVPSPSGRTCSALLFSNFLKENNDIFVHLDSYTGSCLVTFPCIYMCIIALIVSSPLCFFFLS